MQRGEADYAAEEEQSGVPLLIWLGAGVLASVISGAMTLAVAVAGSAAAGLPWRRPVQVIASLTYGPAVAVSEQWDSRWFQDAATLAVPAVLVCGSAFGLLVALLGFRPSRRVAVWLGLLVSFSAWLIVVKIAGPLMSPITVRLVPAWTAAALFTMFGLGLALASPIAAGLSLLCEQANSGAAAANPAPSDTAKPRRKAG